MHEGVRCKSILIMAQNDKVQHLLASIAATVDQWGELKHSYQEQTELHVARLTTDVAQLAPLVDSLAERARVVRELYWVRRLSVKIIAPAFGLKEGQVMQVAGPMTFDLPCANDCGSFIKQTFTNRTKLQTTSQAGVLCDKCTRQQSALAAQSRSERERAFRQRRDELQRMSWEVYTGTREWQYIRATVLHLNEYNCQICKARNQTLGLYLGKATPLCHPRGFYDFSYYVLCRPCTRRCEDLIDRQRCEIIAPERFGEIEYSRAGY